jgi:hypothetical protein
MSDMPEGSPRSLRRIYIFLGCFGALMTVATVGLNAIPPLKNGLTAGGRAVHLFSPRPVNDVGPLSTGWQPSGSTWASASQDYIRRAKAANPDYEVTFHPGREYTDSGPFNTNVRYRYEGSVTYEPHWEGII